MDDAVRRALVQLVDEVGPEIFNDPQELAELLADDCFAQRAERRVIVAAVEEGVAETLRARGAPTRLQLGELAGDVRRRTGIGELESLWAVEAIAASLGLAGGAGGLGPAGGGRHHEPPRHPYTRLTSSLESRCDRFIARLEHFGAVFSEPGPGVTWLTGTVPGPGVYTRQDRVELNDEIMGIFAQAEGYERAGAANRAERAVAAQVKDRAHRYYGAFIQATGEVPKYVPVPGPGPAEAP